MHPDVADAVGREPPGRAEPLGQGETLRQGRQPRHGEGWQLHETDLALGREAGPGHRPGGSSARAQHLLLIRQAPHTGRGAQRVGVSRS